MDVYEKCLRKIARCSLTGEGAHVLTEAVFTGIPWKFAGLPEDASHSLYQLLEHITFWQDWVLRWLEEKNPLLPVRQMLGLWPPPSGGLTW